MSAPNSSMKMSADAVSTASTERAAIDRAVAEVREKAREFARLPAAAKAALVRECIQRVLAAAESWVAEGAKARGADPSEEWLAGVTPTLRGLRLTAETLEAIARNGRPPLGAGVRTRDDGRLAIDVFPASGIDKVSFAGLTGYALMEEGLDRAGAEERQASFFKRADPDGGVALILGAGNVSSIPPLDAATKMFAEGFVCVLKMNPVNEWVGPILERALAPLISRGYLRIVYGGADVGKYLVYHEGIDDVHITGSDHTHDMIVWGPPGAERERRKREDDPLLEIPISSELGNVSPVAIVPHAYSEEQLWFQARNVVSMVTNNASFNCNAAKMLITARGWAQRERFLELVAKGLASVPPRAAYYPGAADRYASLTEGRECRKLGSASDGQLPWTMIPGVDAARGDERLFRVEPFCSILSETSLGSDDPAEFIAAASSFMNDTLWGTLNAMFVIHPTLERSESVGKALDDAIVGLRYGTIGINHWPALGYAFGTLPWGGHPSSTLHDIQSGLGWVHNSFMLEGIDKAVVRGPIVLKPKPVWFYDNTKLGGLAPRVARMEANPSWLKVPGMLLRALF